MARKSQSPSANWCDASGLRRGPWSSEEDQKLLSYIQLHGHGSWRTLPQKAGLQRCGKSCRLRWINYLRPGIKRGKFSLHEEQSIIQLHALLGNRWSAIAAHLPRRTDNEIKNHWNTHLKKRLSLMGIDPATHKPKVAALRRLDGSDTKNASTLSHMAQWEAARLEAEARLVRESNSLRHHHHVGDLPHQLQPPDHSTTSALHHQLLLNKMPSQVAPPPTCLDVLRTWQNANLVVGLGSSNLDPSMSKLAADVGEIAGSSGSVQHTWHSSSSTTSWPRSSMDILATTTSGIKLSMTSSVTNDDNDTHEQVIISDPPGASGSINVYGDSSWIHDDQELYLTLVDFDSTAWPPMD